MTTTDKAFYVTTPIYYVNDKPHIGHIYTSVAADVLARFRRLDGYRVKFVTGTDEHGQKVLKAAMDAGEDPKRFVDRLSENFRNLREAVNYSNDDFVRTTEHRHTLAAQDLWRRLEEAGQIYLGSYSGWYAVRDEAYYAEDELSTGPNGEKIAPSGAVCEWVEEESYFFRLSAWQDKLLELYENRPDFVLPQTRLNEVAAFVRGGLNDLSISRTQFDWGVPVPGDEHHVMYVWIDALTNYLTVLGFPDTDNEDFRTFWPHSLHLVGKDILRFHAVYWPAFLMAAGLEPPARVFAHGWWTREGQKMSKSLGNVITPEVLIGNYGIDAARYVMLRAVPFGNDGDFVHEQAVRMINADLANGLGNLAQRTLSMIHKNCGGALPAADPLSEADKALLAMVHEQMLPRLREEFDVQRMHKGLEAIWDVVREANQYIDEQAPWTLRKTDQERMKVVLAVLAEVIRCLGIVIQPVMPDSAAKLLDQLCVPEDARDFARISPDAMLPAGAPIDKPEGVFPRIEDTP